MLEFSIWNSSPVFSGCRCIETVKKVFRNSSISCLFSRRQTSWNRIKFSIYIDIFPFEMCCIFSMCFEYLSENLWNLYPNYPSFRQIASETLRDSGLYKLIRQVLNPSLNRKCNSVHQTCFLNTFTIQFIQICKNTFYLRNSNCVLSSLYGFCWLYKFR